MIKPLGIIPVEFHRLSSVFSIFPRHEFFAKPKILDSPLRIGSVKGIFRRQYLGEVRGGIDVRLS